MRSQISIGCFVETYNWHDWYEATALKKFKKAAEKKGYRFDFIYKKDIPRIPQYDSIFIRAVTDPTYTACLISKIAENHQLRVVDRPRNIQICSNKIHMYGALERHHVPYLPTKLVTRDDLTASKISELFEEYGTPLVIKAPYTAFSKFVEKVTNAEEFTKVSKRFFRKSDVIVVQKYCRTDFDWRVGVVNDQALWFSKYLMAKNSWKHIAHDDENQKIYGNAICIRPEEVPPRVKEVAIQACQSIGPGLYGVDLKQFGDEVFVVEVNDNPTICHYFEDRFYKNIYSKIIDYVVGEEC